MDQSKMSDLFDNIILCKQCGKKMAKGTIIKNGIAIRAAFCKGCEKKDYHPLDLERYNEFRDLKRKPFRVKLRLVGNSYAVSIPKEIVLFMREQEKMFNDIVRLAFDDAKKLKLMFGEEVME